MDPVLINQILTYAAAALISGAVGCGGMMLLREARTGARRRARLAGPTPGARPGQGGQTFPSIVGGVKRLGEKMAIQDPAQISNIRVKLIHAGWYNREAVAFYLGARGASLIVATLATVLTVPWAMSGIGGPAAIGAAGIFAIAAILGPDHVVKGRRRKMELEYTEGFPDMLDLLVASVEAGLSLDAGVTRVAEEMGRRYPNLATHLRFLTLELRAGKARKEAWTAFSDRLGIDDARSLATMLRQAEEMGSSLGETLAVFSDDMRSKRMLKAEEKAMALPAKLMVPLILFIFPCLLGVLILPAAYRISQSMVGGGP
jgi:tight adherence protein C